MTKLAAREATAPKKAKRAAAAAPKRAEGPPSVANVMAALGRKARAAARALALAPTAAKNAALQEAAREIRAQPVAIIAENKRDLVAAKAAGVTPAFLDRLALDEKRVEAM